MATRIIDAGHEGTVWSGPEPAAGFMAMVLESVGPMRHAVNVPFHDSQARGKAILIRTGWDAKWGTAAYDEPGPYLHEELVFRLIRSNVRLVGVDFGHVDPEQVAEMTSKEIVLVQNLRGLKSLPTSGFLFHVSRTAAAIRAFAEITI
jgi:kynurenine formamidase